MFNCHKLQAVYGQKLYIPVFMVLGVSLKDKICKHNNLINFGIVDG